MNTQILTPIRLFFIIFFLSNPITCKPYTPSDNIAVNCGASGSKPDPDGRSWYGDISSNISLIESLSNNRSITSSAQKQPVNTIPYSTARISLSEFTYVFSLSSSGPIFIRLHFYPNSYQEFDPSKAFFSVKANQYTLLSNFSASLTATSLGEDTLVKEYCINLENPSLNVTLTPSNTPSDAYAFVNGIEIVSMPTDLYYESIDVPEGFKFIGNEENPYHLLKITAMELVHRLNVGGAFIKAVDDTGMYRMWKTDDGYYNFVGALPENHTINPIFKPIPNYTAPDQVYQTARSMGNDRKTNEGYNLTWDLPVDSNFMYMVRLHFCEFQPEITEEGDRQFIIYIVNDTAEAQADVILWSGGNSFAIYRDYAVLLGQGIGKKQNLSIALHPAWKTLTRYSDGILNGIEVFKLSFNNGNLAGPNPDPLPTPPVSSSSIPTPAKSKSKRTALIAGICAGMVLVLIAGFILGFFIFRRGKGRKDSSMSYVSAKSGSSGKSLLPSDLCRHFSLAEIRAATKNFDSIFIIGRGGFGDVYRGHIDGVDSPVAIKRLNPGSKQGVHEFMTEIEMLSQLRHIHLVSLIGYCNEDREMILVYDYMSHGTLRDHLYKSDSPPLSWKQRLHICIGAAKGLHYLHSGAKRMIIHRDVKSTNILLDDKWVAKVSDFGLSKMNPDSTMNTHISTAVKGSFGYLDPEYYRRQQLTEKSDVYSFGVVLFEVLCARPVLDKTLERDQISLAVWARKCYEKGRIEQIVDPYLTGKIAPRCLKKFVEVAMSCLHDEGIERPSMNDVIWNLEFALQLQENFEDDKGVKLGEGSKEFEDGNPLIFHSDSQVIENDRGRGSTDGVSLASNNGTSFTTNTDSSQDKLSSGVVFSEIMNPIGR